MRSTPPPRAPRCPDSGDAHFVPRRKSLDVAGNMLRGVDATPILSTALANSAFALAEPDPFTLANLTTKSLTRWSPSTRSTCCSMRPLPVPRRSGNVPCPMRQSGHRSAHNPQCRQTSSSFAMMRPVLSSPEIYSACARSVAGALSLVRSSASSPFPRN